MRHKFARLFTLTFALSAVSCSYDVVDEADKAALVVQAVGCGSADCVTQGLGTAPSTEAVGMAPAEQGLGTPPAEEAVGTPPTQDGIGTADGDEGLSRTLTIVQLNMAGAARNYGGSAVAGRTARLIAQHSADAVSLNEVCATQVEDVLFALQLLGHPMHAHFARTTARFFGTWCIGPAGNAVLTTAPQRDATDYYYEDVERQLIRSEPQSRGVTCVTAEFERSIRVCSAHLTPNDDLASREIHELARVLGPEAISEPMVLAGDLNVPLTATQSAAYASLYAAPRGSGRFWEVDMLTEGCGSALCGERTSGGDKLDYIFVSASHFGAQPSAVVEPLGQCIGSRACSDHDALIGSVQLKL